MLRMSGSSAARISARRASAVETGIEPWRLAQVNAPGPCGARWKCDAWEDSRIHGDVLRLQISRVGSGRTIGPAASPLGGPVPVRAKWGDLEAFAREGR